jgi:mono/diheme cytochrome c family protein
MQPWYGINETSRWTGEVRSMKHPVSSRTRIILGLVLSLVLAAPFAAVAEKAKADGKSVFEQKCLKCHKPEKFKSQHNSRKDWELILSRMERNSCVLTEAETNAVAEYLAKHYGE